LPPYYSQQAALEAGLRERLLAIAELSFEENRRTR